MRSRGFTLLELLVVIAIIVLLMALLLPAVQRVRATVDRLRCGNNLRQLGLALHHYHNDYGKFPPAFVSNPARWSWGVAVLPYIEEDSSFRLFRQDLNWDHPDNQLATRKNIKLMTCPSAGDTSHRENISGGQSYGLCDYSPIFDIDPNLIATGLLLPWTGNPLGVMDDLGARIGDIFDGTTNTILLAEVAGRPQWYQKGQHIGLTDLAGWSSFNNITPINLDGFSADGSTMWGPCAINCNNIHEVYSFHPLGANTVFADGRVVFLKASISIQTMAALVTRAGDDTVNADDLD